MCKGGNFHWRFSSNTFNTCRNGFHSHFRSLSFLLLSCPMRNHCDVWHRILILAKESRVGYFFMTQFQYDFRATATGFVFAVVGNLFLYSAAKLYLVFEAREAIDDVRHRLRGSNRNLTWVEDLQIFTSEQSSSQYWNLVELCMFHKKERTTS